MTKTTRVPKSQTELLAIRAAIGSEMDKSSDAARLRFLLRARAAVTASLQAARDPQAPYRFVGMSADGLAIYEG
jgi:hypothetical protein